MALRGNTTNATIAESPGKVKVKTTTTTVLSENLERSGAEFVNEGANSIYLNLGKAAESEVGIFLAANGGTWNGMVGPITWTGSVTGIAPSGETSLTVVVV